MQTIEEIEDRIKEFESDCKKIPIVNDFCEVTGLPPTFVGGLLLTASIWYTVLNFPYMDLAIQIVGTLYPCYMTVKALQTEHTQEDDKQWLTYWTVFGTFKVADHWVSFLVELIPCYNILKLVFLIYLFSPYTLGAVKIYNALIKPLGTYYRDDINSFRQNLDRASENYAETLKQASKQLAANGPSMVLQAVADKPKQHEQS